MKKTLLTIFVLLLIIQANAQQFIYDYKSGELVYSDEFILAIDDNQHSYFNTVNYAFNKEYMDNAKAKGITVDIGKMNKGSLLKNTVEKTKQNIFHYDNLLGAKVVLLMDKEDFNWQLVSETKQVDGKTLHKATTHYGGRDWVAWYNMEIPLQEGPYVFAGLPGLIEEVYDLDKKHQFILKGKSPKKYEIEYVKTEQHQLYTKISEKEYFQLIETAKENPYEFSESHRSFKIIDYEVPSENKRRFSEFERKRLNYFTIERPEPTQ